MNCVHVTKIVVAFRVIVRSYFDCPDFLSSDYKVSHRFSYFPIPLILIFSCFGVICRCCGCFWASCFDRSGHGYYPMVEIYHGMVYEMARKYPPERSHCSVFACRTSLYVIVILRTDPLKLETKRQTDSWRPISIYYIN